MLRNLNSKEIDCAIEYYNLKYDLDLKRYSNNPDDIFILNNEIQQLKDGIAIIAIISVIGHTFAIKIDRINGKNNLIVDDSYALLNIEDYKETKSSIFEFFCYLNRKELVFFIQQLKNIDKIYINKARYQLDAGSCQTFALINAKALATTSEYFQETKINNNNSLGHEIHIYPSTKNHKKYTQADQKMIEDNLLYPESFAIHKKTEKIRRSCFKFNLWAYTVIETLDETINSVAKCLNKIK